MDKNHTRHGRPTRKTPFMKYLKYWRLVKGKNQKEIADYVGISQSNYCEIEKRGKLPHPDIYPKLAEALGRPVEELVSKLHGVNPAEMMDRTPALAK